ncbi:MAG: hypothetical protein IPP73_07920 [Chitinophagaceae bacterium]|nr:hypothetical protein [Chitinophagaceae bacterium]
MKRTSLILLTILAWTTLQAQPLQTEMSSTALYRPVEQTRFFTIGDRRLPVKILQFGPANGIVYINLHDNENSSVDAALVVLEQQGGTLIKIENNDQRVISFRLQGQTYRFDPNRIYSRAGIEQTLRENRRYHPQAVKMIDQFAQEFLTLIPDSTHCVIALHNNTDEAYSVKSYMPGHERAKDAMFVYCDSLQDVDDIFFTTDTAIYSAMSGFGYNAICQDNEKVKKDGSLSVYFGQIGRRYVNLETEHGRTGPYLEMLNRLVGWLETLRKTPEGENRP